MNKATNAPALIVPPNPPMTTNTVAEDIRDIRDPVPIPGGWLWAAWLLGAGALVALAWLAWKRLRLRPARRIPAPVIPPHERARRKLQDALDLLDQPKPFCTLVSDAVRLYLEERFDLRAPERTTEEFLEELRNTRHLTPPQKDSLAEFLARCDLVKFARVHPAQTALQDLYNSALRLIEETEPRPEAPAVPVGPSRLNTAA
jgi:hypothetical protein